MDRIDHFQNKYVLSECSISSIKYQENDYLY
jgi:hypothetical protein